MDNSTTILKKSQRTTKVKVKEQVQKGGVTVKRTRGAVAVAQPVIKINIAKEKEPVKPVRRRAPKKKPSDESGDGKPPGSALGSAFLYPQVISRTVQQGPSLSDILSLIRAQQATQPTPTVVTAPSAVSERPPTPIIPSARVIASLPPQMAPTQVDEPVKVKEEAKPAPEAEPAPPKMEEPVKKGPRRGEKRLTEKEIKQLYNFADRLNTRQEVLNRKEEELRLEQARLMQAPSGIRRNIYDVLTPVSEPPSEEEVEVPSEGPSQVLEATQPSLEVMEESKSSKKKAKKRRSQIPEGVTPLPVVSDEERLKTVETEINKVGGRLARYKYQTVSDKTRKENEETLKKLQKEKDELIAKTSQGGKRTLARIATQEPIQEPVPQSIQEPVVEPTFFKAPERPAEQPSERPAPIAPSFPSIRRVGQTPRREEDRPMAIEGGRMVGQ